MTKIMSRAKRPRTAEERGLTTDDYGSQRYWQARYSSFDCSDKTNEWLFSWKELKPLFNAISQTAAILDLGCGTSELCFQLSDAFPDGKIIGVDNAPAAIEKMRLQQAQWPGPNAARVELLVLDALQLDHAFGTYESATIDVAVDKSTFDAMMCDQKRGRGAG